MCVDRTGTVAAAYALAARNTQALLQVTQPPYLIGMKMKPEDLLIPRREGLYCPPGDFFIDPVRGVDRALITHGHADHARAGHGHVLATAETLDIMAIRYGADHAGATQPAGLGEVIRIGDVTVTFHPAGHVLGSAQIAVEMNGMRIVASGDYKPRPDPTCATFEPVACDVFITEATFALPVFRHPDAADEIRRLLRSVSRNPDRAHLVGVYSLGKAQRVIRLIRDAGHHQPLYIHGALQKLCDYYESRGIALGDLRPATVDAGAKGDFAGAIILGPPSAFGDKWARRFPDPLVSFASGWMQVRARARQRGVELPLVISDHADWDELAETIKSVAPGEVWVTHGREEALVRWCAIHGIPAKPLHLVGYEDEGD
jgi:putative mRNA 3-end processing factor